MKNQEGYPSRAQKHVYKHSMILTFRFGLPQLKSLITSPALKAAVSFIQERAMEFAFNRLKADNSYQFISKRAGYESGHNSDCWPDSFHLKLNFPESWIICSDN